MIVDASVALKWIVLEDDSGAAMELLGRDDLASPDLLLIELGNALWNKKRQSELDGGETLPIRLALAASLVDLVNDASIIPVALDMAVTLNHAIYDCVYLALAVQTEDVLITADRKFVNKVLASRYAASVRLF